MLFFLVFVLKKGSMYPDFLKLLNISIPSDSQGWSDCFHEEAGYVLHPQVSPHTNIPVSLSHRKVDGNIAYKLLA